MFRAASLRACAQAVALLLVSGTASAEREQKETPISLETMLAHAEQHAPKLVVSRAALMRGEAEVEAADVVLQGNTLVRAAAGPRFAGSATGVDAQVQVSQRIEIAGERKQRRQTAQKLRELTRKQLEEVSWVVHQEVHAAFHIALVQRERWDLVQKLLLSTQELRSVAERRLRAGDISQLALRLAEAELAQARQAEVAARQGYRTAQFRLAEVSGWPLDTLPEPRGKLDEPRRPPPTEELLRRAAEQHPGLIARSSAVDAAEAQVRLQDREMAPEPFVGASYMRESEPATSSVEHIVLGTLLMPIPFSQRNQAERARARAELMVRRAERNAFEQQLRAQLATAAAAVEADADRIAAYGTEILPAFEGNLALLQRAFELGEVDLLQVFVARERMLRIQEDALTAHEDYYRDVAALEAAVGVEIWPDEHDGHSDEHEEDGGQR